MQIHILANWNSQGKSVPRLSPSHGENDDDGDDGDDDDGDDDEDDFITP